MNQLKSTMGLIVIVAVFPFVMQGQVDTVYKGIHFEKELNWEQIMLKAKEENKYIFIDCYTTWCTPCKAMDNLVFKAQTVGSYINEKFISVKIQIDTNKLDKEDIKRWYPDARDMALRYKINSFPTFLFFSPDANLVHRGVGYKIAADFIELSSNALDPQKQVYTRVNDYLKGNKDYRRLPDLAQNVRTLLNDNDLAIVIGQDYLKNYLYKLKEDDLFKKENIELIASFIQNSKEKGFKLFYQKGSKVDQVMNKIGYAQSIVDFIITKQEIEPNLPKDSTTEVTLRDWNKIHLGLEKKYSKSYADRTILNAQIQWYYDKKNWVELAQSYINKFERYGLDTTGIGVFFLNNIVWEVFFEHNTNKDVLNKGIEWMQKVIKLDSNVQNHIDTYANLLYKVGRVKEAIEWEQKAVKLQEEKNKNLTVPIDNMFKLTLEKMQLGQPTWPIE